MQPYQVPLAKCRLAHKGLLHPLKWFTILRLYSPLPSFFTKEWQPSEIALVN
jgi:hypothetical protein